MASWINGSLVRSIGGYVQFWNWTKSGASGMLTPGAFNYFDVARWELTRNTIAAPVWYGGCYGSIRRRVVALDWSLYLRVWWDAKNEPDWAGEALPENFAGGDSLALKLVIGNDADWTGNNVPRVEGLQNNPAGTSQALINQQIAGLPATGFGYLGSGESFLPCYCAPLGTLTVDTMVDSSEGRAQDGIVVADMQFSGDSLMWFLRSQNSAYLYGSYVNTLANAGLIPTN
jgi:hypothetical protein